MRSWSYFIWIKRLIPLVVILAGVLGYNFYVKDARQRKKLQDEQNALITAKVWIASAIYRNYPNSFINYRDSLFKTSNVSASEMTGYLKAYGDKTEQFNNFTLLVQLYIDSLSVLDLWPIPSDSSGDSINSP